MIEQQLVDALQHARGVAVDLARPRGFASVVHRGVMVGAGTPLTIHYVGRERFSRDCRIFLEDGGTAGEPAHVAGVVRFLVDRRHARAHDEADLGLYDTFLSQVHEAVFAPFIEATLPVCPTMADQLARIPCADARRRLRRVARVGVAWRVSTELEEFRRFYAEMYVPTALARHGADASIAPREGMEAHFLRHGRMLFTVAHDGLPECGLLLCTYPHRPGLLHSWKVGVARCESLPPPTLAAAYARADVAMLEYAVGERFREIDMGWTRAALDNGVFLHKRRFGCEFRRNPEAVGLSVACAPRLRAVLFSHRPVAAWRGDELVCWLGQCGELDDMSEEALVKRLRLAQFSPVRSITLFTHGVVHTRARLSEVLQRCRDDHPCDVDVVETA